MDWTALVSQKLTVEALETELEAAKLRLHEMQRDALSEFEAQGLDQAKASGYTIYKQTTIRASAVDGNQEALNQALRDTGNGEIIQERANVKTLEKLVRDYMRTDGKLPDALDGVVKITPVTDVRLRKS